MTHPIRVGVGGWSYEPWDKTFYPSGLPKARQLQYMSRKMTAVEVNATYYSTFGPGTFAKWAEASPPGFVFSLKAHRFSTVRKTREDMKKSIDQFLGQGLTLLKDKLGPINWQFPPTRKFEREYFETFLSLLPKEKDKVPLRHVLEVRNATCRDPAFLDLLTRHGVTVVHADHDEYPMIRHEGADFAVTRVMRARPDIATGYSSADLDAFAKLYKGWSAKQDVFAFFISGAKERNPAAAMALQAKLGIAPATSKEADELAGGKGPAPAAKRPVAAKLAKKTPVKKIATTKAAAKTKKAPPKKKK